MTTHAPWSQAIERMLARAQDTASADARPHDRANRCEFIVGSYYLLESLLVPAGRLDPLRV